MKPIGYMYDSKDICVASDPEIIFEIFQHFFKEIVKTLQNCKMRYKKTTVRK